jgi:hypothetical protein
VTEHKPTYHNVDYPDTFFLVRNSECLGFTFNTPVEMQIARKVLHGGAAYYDFSAKLDIPNDMEKTHIVEHHSPTGTLKRVFVCWFRGGDASVAEIPFQLEKHNDLPVSAVYKGADGNVELLMVHSSPVQVTVTGGGPLTKESKYCQVHNNSASAMNPIVLDLEARDSIVLDLEAYFKKKPDFKPSEEGGVDAVDVEYFQTPVLYIRKDSEQNKVVEVSDDTLENLANRMALLSMAETFTPAECEMQRLYHWNDRSMATVDFVVKCPCVFFGHQLILKYHFKASDASFDFAGSFAPDSNHGERFDPIFEFHEWKTQPGVFFIFSMEQRGENLFVAKYFGTNVQLREMSITSTGEDGGQCFHQVSNTDVSQIEPLHSCCKGWVAASLQQDSGAGVPLINLQEKCRLWVMGDILA